MITKTLQASLGKILTKPAAYNEPMSRHTTWKIGGPADILAEPANEEEVAALLVLAGKENLPFFVLGNGSNLLVGDLGIRGLVIKIGEAMSSCTWDGYQVRAGAGILLPALSRAAALRSAAGLEFACGIPGSLGGALGMNAGAYGKAIGNLVTKIGLIEYTGTRQEPDALQLNFSYRHSSISGQPAVICWAQLQLEAGNKEQSLKEMQELLRLRAKNQPLEFPSCGSVFRNPKDCHAGYLIEQAALRGLRRGGAMVSLKHGNFIVNLGGATAQDVRALIAQVKHRVHEYCGIELVTEVKEAGEFIPD
ncbi:MAG: UDP-N-acetylmuramate dehydrogenase [Clostridiales bacterium]|nr:UDP-N-acetylmuramate dehydrogenase [Clostridiales bacterium]